MKYLFFILAVLGAQSVFAENIDPIYDKLVRDEVARVYSHGWEDDEFQFSQQDDIWALEYDSNEIGCITTIRGLANKPSYYGKSLYEFWVCIRMDESSHLFAEILDDRQIGD